MRGKNTGRFSPSRGGQEVEQDDSTRWLGTYGDAVTLLMAFFVMLYAMSEVDQVKFEAFIAGLEGPFGNQAVTESMLPSNTGIVGPNTPSTQLPEVPSLAPAQPLPEVVSASATDELTDEQLDQLDGVRQAVEAALAAADLDVADYRLTTRGLIISIASDDVLFETGSTAIQPTGEQIIATLAGVLTQFDNDVLVEGHTDDVPIPRPGYSNWNLSTDRAVAVVGQLISVHEMSPVRLGAAGYADQRPVAPNDTPDNRARNRRVDVLVVATEDLGTEQGDNDG